MKIRATAILVIISTNFLIIIFSISAGILFVQKNIDISVETDLEVMSNIADSFISAEIDKLKLKLANTVNLLEANEERRWAAIMREHNSLYPEFIGYAAIDKNGEVKARAGRSFTDESVINDKYIKQAFHGKKTISSTHFKDNGVVFYVAVPFEVSHNGILIATVPGLYFRDLLSKFIIWETGHIYMTDSDGYAVSNPRKNWVNERFNYITAALTDKDFTQLAATVTRMTQGETGFGYYTVYGIPRICAFRPVSGSEEGWSLGVVAPLPESPIENTAKGLIIVGLISFFLNLIAAIIGSNFIKKSFDKIEILKQEADAANKAKSSFLSTMSHEIRTPMNAILGISEIQLQNESLDPSVKEALEKIYSSGDLLLSIINDILDLSKIEAGKLELIIDKYDIASMISDTTLLNIMRISSKPIDFELNVDENTPAKLIGDELRIKQILNNLLSNAFKYTPAGKVKLSIHPENGKFSEEITLVIVVSDTGQGMTKEQVDKLFDEYSQFNKKANRKTEGTGLGMSITRNLIQIMNGTISVKSDPNKGSEFTVRIPQGKCDSDVLGIEAAKNLDKFQMRNRDFLKKVQISREPMPYGKILIVDDVDANIYVAKGLLAPYEINIESSTSGFHAIERIKNGEVYDIIFMDHMMPEMDGIEAVSHIRNSGYKAPIVALTANAVGDQADIFLQNGFDDFISKPIDIRYLNQLLNKYVRDKQSEEVLKEARMHKKETNPAQKTEIRLTILENKEIEGIDILKGVKRFSGNEQIYIDVLDTYAQSVESMLDTIENVTEDTLVAYRIKVHGIKGTSYDVFAEKTAQDALDLENAAKSGDFGFIKSHNGDFVNNTRTLINNIKEFLACLSSEKPKQKKEAPEKNVLTDFYNASVKYDMDGMDAAMTELEKYQYDSGGDLVVLLREYIDMGNFQQITENLKKNLGI